MSDTAKILLCKGRWHAAGMTEGYRPKLARARLRPGHPSTSLRLVPLPLQGRNVLTIAALALLLAACGKQQVLRPVAGEPLPPKPATSPTQPDAVALLKAPAPYRPGRSDELLTRSETRPDDHFNLPPH